MAALAMLIVLVPQFWVWRTMTGGWIATGNGQQGEGFNFLQPQILNTLFSLKRGLFFWSPLLLMVIPGVFLMRRRVPGWAFPVALYLLLHTYIVSSWHMWWFGGGFGHRVFVEAYVLMALPLAALFAEVRGAARGAVVSFCITAIGVNLFFMKLYYTRELSYMGLDWQALYDILWWRKEWVLQLIR
jgi:hypothetical protein